ncbi:IMP dehydrogenase / GMP reductase domain family protein [Leishmania donovani]|uniref:Inosine-5'-monophosphate dehydrogenase n=1 Tax=Leishmania donovani TaxID=5661 RepID=A0A504XQ57_LEIDO|nr:IMP dehydrogenase / GMP reductase domain family protein [Leishmania donovani]
MATNNANYRIKTIKDGCTAEELFRGDGLTYNDFIILPGFIDFGAADVNISGQFTKRIRLHIPIVSSPMDTITENEMAKTMALMGGVGVLHNNCTVERQVEMVKSVKAYRNGFISKPKSVPPNTPISNIIRIKEEKGISGILVTENGDPHGKLLGIVCTKDIDYVKNKDTPVSAVMTRREKMTVERAPIQLEEAMDVLNRSRYGYLPIVNENDEVVNLCSRRDAVRARDYPHSTLDKSGRLICAAATSTRPEDKRRVAALADVGVDVLVLDSSQGNTIYQIAFIKWVKSTYPHLEVVAGNVAQYCASRGVPCTADGGLRQVGDICKALAIGANCAMLGGMLSGTTETPGEYFFKGGVRLKVYRGMGSLEAMSQGKESGKRYLSENEAVQVAQGVSGNVVDKGSAAKLIAYVSKGLQQSAQDIGEISFDAIREKMYAGQVLFSRRSPTAQGEGGVHSLHSYEKKLFAAKM